MLEYSHNTDLKEFDMVRRERNPEQAALEAEWEAKLAAEGLAANLRPEQAETAGDALEVADPDSAAERAELAAREEAGDALYSNQ
jgi:hypothetical protein